MKKIHQKYILLGMLISMYSISGFSQIIKSNSALVFPQAPATTFITQNGENWAISSSRSITFGPGTTLQSGSTVSIKIDNPLTTPTAPNNPSEDLDKNWTFSRVYDEDGNVLGETKSFFGSDGKLLQTQSKNESTNHVIASQVLYDIQGRAVASTLPAPVNNSAFAYKSNFVSTTSGTPYTATNFDADLTTYPYTPFSKTLYPDAVGNTEVGTLGWYYSNNNNFEPAVATVGLPFSRTEYYRDGTGEVKLSAGVGDALKLGSGHEVSSVSFPVLHELDNYLSIRNKFFATSVVGETQTTLSGKALQTISTDANGTQAISITDLGGKNSLMTGRADASGWLTVSNTAYLNAVPSLYTFNIATASPQSGGPNDGQYLGFRSFTISSNYTVNVTRDGTLLWSGIGNNYVHALTLTGHPYVITSDHPFAVSAADQTGLVYDDSPARVAEPDKSSVYYFQLTSPAAVTLSGNYILADAKSGTGVTGFTSGNTLAAGYYKVVATDGDVTLSYSNKYSNISYNYYNQLGQLVASIAPNGVKMLIDNPGGYSSSTPIPFATTYEYDLQSRLTASTSTDGGRSEFVYRMDGKIRFSQNAEQRAAANGGRFSYTNYDDIGRPFESGEYVPQSSGDIQFAATQSNSALLESTAANGGLTGGIKQDWVKTHYDLPDNSHGISAYIQDEGFLRGAISWTENANSKTWYNYDGDSRVSWVIKQLAGLGNKTLNYTYDAKGNATAVDYQKETAGERFVHHYDYDADSRLINVQTSRDGTNKLQQAKYYYYLHGPLKRVELGDQLQGIDYVYTAQGMLKSINHPSGDLNKDPNNDGLANSFAPDAFGMQMEYFPNDYTRTGTNISSITTGQTANYNGNVNGLSWQSQKPLSVTGLNSPSMYTYSYDPKSQLSAATWGTPDFSAQTFSPTANFKEYGLNYDPNGNITSLQRNNSAGTLTDNFNNYQYQSGTNKLTSVGSTATPTAYASYTYDNLGQLKSAQQAGVPFGMYLKYDVSGKITGIYADVALTQLKIAYTYDEAGNRISKTDNTGSSAITTYYVYDTGGIVLAIYNNTTITEVPVYGSDRLGTYTVSGNSYVYELRDNVGSVRVVVNRVKKSDGTADVMQYNDYYPYGSIARNGGSGYRYEYQGAYAEKDPITGWNNFDLRMYDGKIGRWLSVDPMGQYASPYEGMGNNPVSGYDPSGGYSWFGALWRHTASFVAGNDPGPVYKSGGEWGFNIKDVSYFGPRKLSDDQITANLVTEQLGRAAYFNFHPLKIGQVNPFTGYARGSGAVNSPIIDPIDFAGAFVGSGVKGLLAAGAREAEVLTVEAGMTELQLVTRAAQKAEAAIGGSGGVAGTLKHTYAKNLLSRYQSIYGDRGLSLGSNYFTGPAGRGFLDVVNHNTKMIYDFKFGNAFMSNAQYLKYSNSFPGYTIQIIKP